MKPATRFPPQGLREAVRRLDEHINGIPHRHEPGSALGRRCLQLGGCDRALLEAWRVAKRRIRTPTR